MSQGLEELLNLRLGRLFKPAPKPKQPPKRLYRVKTSWPERTFARFTERAEAEACADANHTLPEKWVDGKWLAFDTAASQERRQRLFDDYYARKNQQS
jgi:hypothetical protein